MELTLNRKQSTGDCTLGDLFINGDFFAFTIEDTNRLDGVKVAGVTAIPAGRYKVLITLSRRFGRPLPLLLDVPNFTGVRIHAGNTSADTEGCILVGLTKSENAIGKSQMAMSLLQPLIQAAIDRGEEVFIDIRNPQ